LQAVQTEASMDPKHCISIKELCNLLSANDKIQGIEVDIKALENKINQAAQQKNNTKDYKLKLFQKAKSPVSEDDVGSLARKKLELQQLLNWMSKQLETLDEKIIKLKQKVRSKQKEQKNVLLEDITRMQKEIGEEKTTMEAQLNSVKGNFMINKNTVGATRPDIKQAIQTFEKEISQILETMELYIEEASQILQNAGLIIESATEPTMAYHTLKELCQELAKNEQKLKTKINAVYVKNRGLSKEKEQLEGQIKQAEQKKNIKQYVEECRSSAIKELSLAELAACVELLSPNENVDDIWKSENREKILCGKLENCTVLSRQYNKKDYSWEGYLLQKDDIIKYMCHFHFDKWGQKLQEWEEKLNPNQPSATPQKTQPQAVSAQTSVLTSSTSTFSPLGLFGLFPASSSPKNKPSSTSSLPLSNKGDELPTSPTK
jgi:chromosome segregation ATPase